MSTHVVEVIKVKLNPHPNADSLSIVQVHGWECAVRTQDWEDGDLAAYIPPDSVVPETEPFAFLKSDSQNWNRIRARRFRGRISLGLLVPAPKGAKEGDDVMEQMGITHYEPPMPLSSGGDNEKAPSGYYPTYDVENFNRYGDVFREREEVIATEKINGESARYVWVQQDLEGGCNIDWVDGEPKTSAVVVGKSGRMYCSSHYNWKKQDEKNTWWQALKQNPWIEEWCRANPGLVLYGETFGYVKNYKYGAKPGQVFFRVFDILDKDRWMGVDEITDRGWGRPTLGSDTGILAQLHWVPEVYRGPFDEAKLRELAEEDSLIDGANHLREGIVISPVKERVDPSLGRVKLKIVSPRYLEKK